MSTASGPISQAARDRLRDQMRHERELAARLLAAEGRLATEIARHEAAVAALQEAIAERTSDVADALITYLDGAGVGVDRAAVILGRPKTQVAKLVRERRAALRDRAASSDAEGGLV